MPTKQAKADLASIIATLKAERQEHLDAIAEIDETFGQVGISAEETPRRGRPPKSKNGRRKKVGRPKMAKKVAKNGRRKKGSKKAAAKKPTKKKASRRKFSKTANDFVLDLLKGGKTMTTAQINSKWKQAKRSGAADNTLSAMAKDGKVKRENIEGKRGSTFSAA